MTELKRLALEIIPDRLYFTSLSTHPTSTDSVRFFTIDYDLHYSPYFADFGPLNVSMLIRFCRALRDRLNQTAADGSTIVFYSSHNPHLRANAGYLIAGFAVLVLGLAPEDVVQMMEVAYPPLLPFRDASYGVAAYQLTVSDVVRGLHKAMALGWIDIDTFNVEEYEYFDAVQNGDWNWIVPGKFIAFSSPIDEMPGREAKQVVPAFRQRNVQLVVRLNEKKYDRRVFTEVGVRHEELQYPDGSTPPDRIVRSFLDMSEAQKGVIAVHCKAGLGRTGTLIAIFLMKHFGLTSREAIAWCRVCRPGSVIGPQQQYLDAMQRRLDVAGDVYRRAVAKQGAAAVHDPFFEQTLSRTGGAAAAATLQSLAGGSNATLNGSSSAAKRATTPVGGRGTSAAAPKPDASSSSSNTRAASPAQRSRPKPLKLIESLPFDAPERDAKRQVTRLQTFFADGAAGAEAEAARASVAAPSDATGRPPTAQEAAAAKRRLTEKAAVSSTGVVRPLLAPGATIFVAGVTGDVPDRRLLDSLRSA